MHNRRFFIAAAAGLSVIPSLSFAPNGAFGAELGSITENELLVKVDPTVWVSWGKSNFPNPAGGTDINRARYLQVGFQNHTFDMVSTALVRKNTHFLDGACLVAEYAFQHQHADGTFDYSEPNGGPPVNPAAPASSLTMFYYDLGHSLLLLNGDDWYLHSDSCAPYRKRIGALRPQIDQSLSWLLSQRALLATDRAASNRTLAHGMAYYFVGKALGRDDAVNAGGDIVWRALDHVSDGVFPEAGGFDSSYQAVNLLFCQWLALHADPGSSFRQRLWSAVRDGMVRERQAVAPSGEVMTAGNSRISATGESLYGHRKSVNSKQVMLALAYYGVLASDPSASDAASRVQTFYGLPTT